MTEPDPHKLMGDPERTALLVIDMQNDFLRPGSPLATPRGERIVPVVSALARAARARGWPVIFTQELHRRDGSDYGIELAFEPPHLVEGSEGAQIVDELTPMEGDVRILTKRRYNAFQGTDLDLWLRCQRIENLLVTGVCTDVCVIATVHAARDLDYRCFVIEDAVDGSTSELHQAALLCMRHLFAYVGTAEEIASLFGLPMRAPPETV